MPTIVTLTIGPSGSGKQYTSMTAARVANAKNLVLADEQQIYLYTTFVGGLNDNDAFVGYTDDATRNIIHRTDPASAWDGTDPLSGFYFASTSGGSVMRPISGVQNMEIDGLCVDGSGTNAAFFSYSNGGNFASAKDLCMQDVNGDSIPNGFDGTLDNVLIINPGDDGAVISTAANKLTVINAGNRGIVAVSGAAITNSFCFGSTNADFSNQGGTHSNNATSDNTAAGANPQINRTSADFANFAGNDFRTASGSALATAGTVDFIGYALESGGGGITLSPTSITSKESFGNPSITLSTKFVAPSSIPSAEVFGVPNVILTTEFINPISITSQESFGTPVILSAAIIVTPTSITSEESFGIPVLLFDQAVLVQSIPSGESFGIPIISDGEAIIIPVEFRGNSNKVAEYLNSTGRFTSEQVNDIIIEWLKLENTQGETFNDLFYNYWQTKGFTGAYTDKQDKWRNE